MTNRYPYAPKVVGDYLREKLREMAEYSGVRVATEVPKTMTTPLVTITMVPATGSANLVLSERRLIIQCWDSKELDAGNLAEEVRRLMFDLSHTRVRWLRGADIIGEPGRLDDPDIAMPRFQITVDVRLRALTN